MGLLSLGDLVEELKKNGQRVYIPLYQRNYRWSNSKTDKCGSGRLMKDILKICNEGKDHFLGMITVYKPKKEECHILDGQQRFITLSLIMKALGMADEGNWVKLEFERDHGFADEKESSPRYAFIYGDAVKAEVDSPIDVIRMSDNFESIKDVIGEKTPIEKSQIYENVLKHLKIFLHVTSRKPIDEFLNMNFNKTPFCAADYIKAYMIMDSSAAETSNPISIKKIMELWKKIEYVLYQLGDSIQENRESLENDMYDLIKKNYTEEKKNRMEVLFEHRYYKQNDKGKMVVNCDSYHKEEALQQEYEVLVRYYNIMKNLLEELSVTDRDGRRYPNYTAYSAYNLLCSKYPKVRFFELFEKEEDVHNVLYKKFNLTNESYKELRAGDRENVNQFMEAMLITENTTKSNQRIDTILNKSMVGGTEKFDDYKNLFDVIFNEFVEIIDTGKKSEELSLGRDNKPFTMEELFKNEKIRQIKIPQIQRDYVMGGSGYYLYCYLCKIRYEELRFRFERYAEGEQGNDVIYEHSINGKRYTKSKFFDLMRQEIFHANDLPTIDRESGSNNFFRDWIPKEIPNRDSGRKERYNSSRKYAEFLVGDIGENIEKFTSYAEGSTLGAWLGVRNTLVRKFAETVEKAKEKGLIFNNDEKYRMNTSCIMGYLDEQGTFWVYDGQQRLTTSVVLLAYLAKRNSREDYKKYLNKFSFEGRDGANQILKSIILSVDWPEKESMKYSIDDNTSYAIYQFWNLLKPEVEKEDDWKEFRSIHPDYIWKGMDFELVLMDEASDAEQMFMEMNEGLKLEGEEKYKAQLCHIMNTLEDKDNKHPWKAKDKERFLRKMDNEWLNVWKDEKKEVEWIKYCITMSYFEIKGYDKRDDFSDLQNLSGEILRLAETAIDLFAKHERKNDNVHNNVNEEAIKLWCDTIEISKFKVITYGLLSTSERSLFFEKEDFKNLIAKYYCFNVENKEELCFKYMQEIRNGRGVVIRNDEEEGDDAGNENEKVGNMILKNRWNRYEYLNIKKWEEDNKKYQEEWKEQCYDLKDIRVEQAKFVRIPFVRRSSFAESEKTDLFERVPCDWKVNDVFDHLSKEVIVENLRYWYYNTKPEDKLEINVDREVLDRIIDVDVKLYETKIRLIDQGKWDPSEINTGEVYSQIRENLENSQNELVSGLVKTAEKYLKTGSQEKQAIYVMEGGFTKWIEWIKSGNIMERPNYRAAIIELAREKGLLYWQVGNDKSRFMELVALCPDDYKQVSDVQLSDFLRLYKNCDAVLEETIGNYIVEYYKTNCMDDECDKILFDFVIWYHKKNGLSYRKLLYAKTKALCGDVKCYKEEQLDIWIELFMGERSSVEEFG